MTEYEIVRGLLLPALRDHSVTSPLAKELMTWARSNHRWLLGKPARKGARLGWVALRRALEAVPQRDEPLPDVLRVAADAARLLGLEQAEARIVSVMIAAQRLPLPLGLIEILTRHGGSLPRALGLAAGAEPHMAERLVRNSPLVRNGLIRLVRDWRGGLSLEIRWRLERLLDRAPADPQGIVEFLVGPRQPSGLPLSAFAHVEDAELLVRLLAGARRENASAVNVLIHGPPGTGKTELARALGAAAGLRLHGVGEALEDGDEPDRWDRIGALRFGQQLLASDPGSALLFDEMEDLIGDAEPGDGDWMRGRTGSKVFINRLLESNRVPVIWTTNAVGNVDPAVLRRMSYILHLPLPSRTTAMGMLARIADEERHLPEGGLAGLIDAAPETGTVLRCALRTARLTGGEGDAARAAGSLVRALRGGELPPPGPGEIDLKLYCGDTRIDSLFERIVADQATDISLLLTGPPGTGKTALAHHLARILDRPLLLRRGSDLLSKWVGQTEQRIAAAFADARHQGAVLLFDEADSLLFDRAGATNSWEVGQVNEMLTWLDHHPLPVIAATNHAARLDPATLRRFVFKLELLPLDPPRAAIAFERFFAQPAPPRLAALRNLTPGDFAVVARQLRFAPAQDAEEIVARLAQEAAIKPEAAGRIGF